MIGNMAYKIQSSNNLPREASSTWPPIVIVDDVVDAAEIGTAEVHHQKCGVDFEFW